MGCQGSGVRNGHHNRANRRDVGAPSVAEWRGPSVNEGFGKEFYTETGRTPGGHAKLCFLEGFLEGSLKEALRILRRRLNIMLFEIIHF